MGEFACLMVILGIALLLCGPISLIISINAMNHMRALQEELRRRAVRTEPEPLKPTQPHPADTTPAKESAISSEEKEVPPLVSWPVVQSAAAPVEMPPVREQVILPPESAAPPAQQDTRAAEFAEKLKKELAAQKMSLELFLGTRGLAIAGSIAVLVGVIYGLKYLYDMKLITELGRTLIVAGGGIVALIIGQVTRKRGYDIVATALAALGFAMLYAADFAAFGFYHLIGTNLAFGLAILITAAGMLYAVRLNEIIVAFISLLGGFLSPVILSSGENRPNTLFSYVLILIGGAMACAAVRKWRSVSRLSFLGTVLLYGAWFNQWYKPLMSGDSIPELLPVAITWLCVFFAVYLIMPVLYGLLKGEVAHRGDVLLILANAIFCYTYIHQILFLPYRPYLALAAVCLGITHFALMLIVHNRCPNDTALKSSLLAISLFFFTIAIPLYLEMYAVALAWAGEGAVLTFIALRYKSKLVQWASYAALAMSVIVLIQQLPMHSDSFNLIFNNAFGSWCFVAAAFYIAHLFYRSDKRDIAQILFVVSLGLLLAALLMEWYGHTEYNFTASDHWFAKGAIVICSVFIILFIIPFFSPIGTLPEIAAAALAIGTSIGALISLPQFYNSRFAIFANMPFVIGLAPLVALAVAAILLKGVNKRAACGYGLGIIFYLWILLTEQIYLYWNYPGRALLAAGLDKGQMWISIMWAVYAAAVIGVGLWRKLITLRYIGLGFFTIVLIKVFIFDMSTLEKVYRIAGFIVLGLVLIAVSYLYQYLKKTGFFEKSSKQSGDISS